MNKIYSLGTNYEHPTIMYKNKFDQIFIGFEHINMSFDSMESTCDEMYLGKMSFHISDQSLFLLICQLSKTYKFFIPVF